MKVVIGKDGVTRCSWPGDDPLYVDYHDREWGFPVADDRRLFEKICLEGFQAGLSWITILRKRENFRRAFDGFDPAAVARFGKRDVTRLLKDAGIVRHRGKIESTINNARQALGLKSEFGSLARYFWQWEKTADAARRLSKDLKERGWTFVGPTTVYSFMQAMGLVNDHPEKCHMHDEVEKARRRFVRPLPSPGPSGHPLPQAGEGNLQALLRSMDPFLHEGEFVFCAADDPPAEAIATFREEEGVTVVISRQLADELSLPYSYVAAWITLRVHSDLNAVGFLAAITHPLAEAGISCNVIAALFHDHLFVPYEKRHAAMEVLSRRALE